MASPLLNHTRLFQPKPKTTQPNNGHEVMSTNAFVMLLLIVSTSMLSGCSGARRVVKATDHGVIAIPADTNSWPMHHREKAEELMAAHFPDGYVIEHEEEAVIGKNTQIDTDGTDGIIHASRHVSIGTGTTNTTVTTTDKTEWRIHYRRK